MKSGIPEAAGLAFLVLCLGSCGRQTLDTGPVIESRDAGVIPRYGIFEISFQHTIKLENPFLDSLIDARFHSPDGRLFAVKGFYYGHEIWKLRFRPDARGRWTYSYTFRNNRGMHHSGSGLFHCTGEDALSPLRLLPDHPYLWTTAAGGAYFPIGLQECVGIKDGHVAPFAIDGEGRSDPARTASWLEYLSIYGESGFNLWRFSQRNCSYLLFADLDHYLETEGLVTDEMLALARQKGFRVMFGIFGYHGQWFTGTFPQRMLHYLRGKVGLLEEAIVSGHPGIMAKEKRFIDYCVARWGVYVDFWELLNERQPSDAWTAVMAAYTHSVDPYHSPVTTSYEKPELKEIAINAPHWYESEKETVSDLRVVERAQSWKRFGKPVLVGEQGNLGMNWDPRSAVRLRLRLRLWTALFQEIGIIFWNTSWSKYGMNGGVYKPENASNIYLGPEERGYVRILSQFSSRLDNGIRPISVSVSDPGRVRAYGLASASVIALYLHHYADRDRAETSTRVSFVATGAAPAQARWIDPVMGEVVGTTTLSPGMQSISVPSFTVDIALLAASKR